MQLAARRLWLTACLAALAQHAAAGDSGWQPFVEARAWAAYDAIAVKQLNGDWRDDFDPRGGRNVMLQRYRAEIGVDQGDWRLGWEYRQEATLRTDRQTLEFVRRYKQRTKPPDPASFALAAGLERWSAQGPKLARWFGSNEPGRLPRLQLSGALYTKASLRATEVAGTVGYVPLDQYAFNVQRGEADSAARYPFMQQGPRGAGASVSMALAWQLSPSVSADARIDDLWSQLRLSNLPIKEDRIDSQVSSYDADGYINYRPLLSGSNRQADVRRALGRAGAFNLHGDAGPALLSAGIERLAGITIPSVGVAHRFGWGTLSGRFESRFKTVSIGIETRYVDLALQTDSVKVGKARALGVTAGLRY